MKVGTYGRTASVYNLLSQSERFGLSSDAANKEIDAIVATVRTWRDHFQAASVPAKDIEYISPAFLPECFYLRKPVERLGAKRQVGYCWLDRDELGG